MCVVPVSLLAATPETSDFTSVKQRIEDRSSAGEVSTRDPQHVRIEHGQKAGWLAPIALDCSAETWLNFVKNFRKRFRNEAAYC